MKMRDAPSDRIIACEDVQKWLQGKKCLSDDVVADHFDQCDACAAEHSRHKSIDGKDLRSNLVRPTESEIIDFLKSHLDDWDSKTKVGRFADFNDVSLLAWGGMGIVLKALDKRLDRVVAVKTLRPDAITDDRAKNRFKKEAIALARLEHDHIVTIFDVGEQKECNRRSAGGVA